MKTIASPSKSHALTGLATAFAFLPTLASAHPGHYHPPGETDEFDAMRANFLHLHGSLEIGIACLAVASVVIFKLNRKRPVRVTAAVAFCGSLAFLATH